MEYDKLMLIINPGSTSTKIALYKNDECVKQSNLSHNIEELKKYETVYDQKDMRKEVILSWLREQNISLEELKAVVGRGGILRPMPGGTYCITEKMLEDLRMTNQTQHAANLGAIIAFEIASLTDIPSFIVDPIAVDEFEDVARISGLCEITRKSLVHALNIKAVTRKVCIGIKKSFNDSSFVVAHLGGGISIAPLKNGKILDVNNANEEGPFSPERSGTLPVGDLVRMAFCGRYTCEELKKKITHQSGLIAYLGTNDARIVDRMIDDGNKKAEFILKAMAYQIAKEIGAMAVVLEGKVDRVILTGGLAYNKRLTEWIEESVSFIAPVEIVPGEEEMLALYEGAARVLNGIEKAKIYEDEVYIKT